MTLAGKLDQSSIEKKMAAVHFPTSRTHSIRHKKRHIATLCMSQVVMSWSLSNVLYTFLWALLRFTFATLKLWVNVPATICSFFPQRIRFTTEFTDNQINFALMRLTHELQFMNELWFHDMQSLTQNIIINIPSRKPFSQEVLALVWSTHCISVWKMSKTHDW